MKIVESFVIAFRSLLSSKLRSSLTILGIIIGVGAVITLMSVGRGAQASITSTFEDMGSNLLTVIPSSGDIGGFAGMSAGFLTPTLTLDDTEALERIRSILRIAPVNENYAEVSFEGETKVAIIHGSTPAYMGVYGYTMEDGRFITDRDVASRDTVVVLGAGVVETLFDDDNPIGQKVKIKGNRFTVAGVLEAKGGALMGFSLDDVIVVPITVYQTKLFTQRTAGGKDAVQSIAIQVVSADLMDIAGIEIEEVLRKTHRIGADEDDDFTVVSLEQMLGMLQQITGIFTIVLGAIASISLLVGSIGIMNIMLVTVTERTREIGIRKAIGAKRRDILLQFLVEAAMLSFAGGGIGIAGGWGLALLISSVEVEGFALKAEVTPDIVILAVSVSVIIGLFSGIYPAMRAARLNPIEALRYG